MIAQLQPRGKGTVVANDVRHSFGEEPVLHDLSLRLEAGTTAGLIGANGSGKTTLLRILAGVLEPEAGSTLIAGHPPGRGFAGFVPAGDRMLNWRLTGGQNLEFYARIAGVPSASLSRTVRAAAEATVAVELLHKRAGECSTGQRRRLMLAVALAGSPPLVLLDEPFADLDDEGCRAVEQFSRRWAEYGGSVLYAAPGNGQGPPCDVELYLRGGRLQGGSES